MNKNLRNGGLIVGGLAIAYYLTKDQAKQDSGTGSGSFGGSDEPAQYIAVTPQTQQGQHPIYVITTLPQDTSIQEPSSYEPSSSEPLFSEQDIQNYEALGTAIGTNLILSKISKSLLGNINKKYLPEIEPESKLRKFFSDPYQLTESKPLLKEVSGETISNVPITQGLKTMPKWAKGVKTIANYLPTLDIFIGTGLDVYLTRDTIKPIPVWTALKSNIAGEFAQISTALGITLATGGTGIAGSWLIGTASDIATTEAYYSYAGYGMHSIFGGDEPQIPTITKSDGSTDYFYKGQVVNYNPTAELIAGSKPASLNYGTVSTGTTTSGGGSSSHSSGGSSSSVNTTPSTHYSNTVTGGTVYSTPTQSNTVSGGTVTQPTQSVQISPQPAVIVPKSEVPKPSPPPKPWYQFW